MPIQCPLLADHPTPTLTHTDTHPTPKHTHTHTPKHTPQHTPQQTHTHTLPRHAPTPSQLLPHTLCAYPFRIYTPAEYPFRIPLPNPFCVPAYTHQVIAHGHNFSKGHLRFEAMRIGRGAEMQPLSQILPGSEVPDGARIEAKSLVLSLGKAPNCVSMAGNPARTIGRHYVHLERPDRRGAQQPQLVPWWQLGWRNLYIWCTATPHIDQYELPR